MSTLYNKRRNIAIGYAAFLLYTVLSVSVILTPVQVVVITASGEGAVIVRAGEDIVVQEDDLKLGRFVNSIHSVSPQDRQALTIFSA